MLLDQRLVSEAQLLEALSDISGQRSVNLGDFEINHSVSSLVPAKIAERLGITPLSIEGGVLHVACTYPVPARELGEVGFLLGKKLELWVALDFRVRQWLHGLYGLPLSRRYTDLLAAFKADPAEAPSTVVQEPSLEEALARDMVERLATSGIGEPIPTTTDLIGPCSKPEKRSKRRRAIRRQRSKWCLRSRNTHSNSRPSLPCNMALRWAEMSARPDGPPRTFKKFRFRLMSSRCFEP